MNDSAAMFDNFDSISDCCSDSSKGKHNTCSKQLNFHVYENFQMKFCNVLYVPKAY